MYQVAKGSMYGLSSNGKHSITVLTSIQGFIDQFAKTGEKKIDYVVVNAGILKYPNVRP